MSTQQKKPMSKKAKVLTGLGAVATVAAVGGAIYYYNYIYLTKKKVAALAVKNNAALTVAQFGTEQDLTNKLIAVASKEGVILIPSQIQTLVNHSIVNQAAECEAILEPQSTQFFVVTKCPKGDRQLLFTAKDKMNAAAFATAYNMLVAVQVNRVVADKTSAPTPASAEVPAPIVSSSFYDEGYENFW